MADEIKHLLDEIRNLRQIVTFLPSKKEFGENKFVNIEEFLIYLKNFVAHNVEK